MKRTFALILSAVLLFAFAAAASAEITIGDLQYDSGRATITWTDPDGAGPYKTAYQYQDPGGCPQCWFWGGGNEAGSTAYGTSFTFNDLAPERTYIVSVEDANGHEVTKTVTTPQAYEFEDGKLTTQSVKVKLEHRYTDSKAKKFKKLKNGLKASEIKDNQGVYYYGVKYEKQMPRLSKPRTYFEQIVFTAPNGFSQTVIAKDNTMQFVSARARFWWELLGDSFFANMINKLGDVVPGTYSIDLYWDGMFVNHSTFEVK